MIIIGIIAAPLTVQSLMSSSILDLRELNVTIVNSNQIEQGCGQDLSILANLTSRRSCRLKMIQYMGIISQSFAVHFLGMSLSLGFSDIKVEKEISAKSMDRLSKDMEQMMIRSELMVNNPSIFQNKRIGSFSSDTVKNLVPGTNKLSVSGILKPEDVVSSSELFSSLVNGRPVLLTANLTSVSNHFIAGGLIGTELDVTVSGKRMPLVSGSSIFFPRLALRPVESSIVELDAEIQLELVDIFGQDSPFALTGISLLSVSAFYQQSMAANLQVIPDKILRLSRYRYSLSFASLATVSPVPFSQLLLDFFNSTELEVEIRCTCNVNITTAMGNLTLTGVYLTQDLVLKGCGGLRDVEVDSIQVFSSVGGSLLFSAEGSFRNPSNASASLGAIALALERRGLRLGQVFSQSMSIGPGKNVMRVSGHLLPSSKEEKDELGQVVGSFLRGERVDLQLVGLSAQSFDSEWLQQVVEKLSFNIPFQSPAPNISVESFNVSSADVSLSDGGDILFSCSLWVQVTLPFEAALDVTSLSADLILSRTADSSPLARLTVPLTDVVYDAPTSRLFLSLVDQSLVVLDEDLVAQVLVEAQEAGGASVRLSGNVSSTLRFDFGEILVDSLPLLLELPLHVSGSELGRLIHVSDLDFVDGNSSDQLPFSLHVNVNNPTAVSADVGDVTLGISPTGCLVPAPMMLVEMKALHVSSGWSHLIVNGLYRNPPDPQQYPCAADFISALVGGRPVNISVVESHASAPLVQAVLRAMRLRTELNGLPVRLQTVARAIMLDPVPVFRDKEVHVRVDVRNPFSVDARVSQISLSLEAEGGDIGRFEADMTLNPLLIPRSKTTLTPELCVDLLKLLDLALFRAFIKAAASKGGAEVHVTGSVRLTLGAKFSSTLFLDRQAVRDSGRDISISIATSTISISISISISMTWSCCSRYPDNNAMQGHGFVKTYHTGFRHWLYLREGGEIVYVNETIEDLEPEDNYTPTLRMNHDFKSVLDMRLREYGLEDENLCLRGGLDEEQIDEFLGRAGPEMQTLDNKDFDEYYKNRANDMGVPENPDWDDYLNNDDLLKSFTNSDEEKVEIDSHFGVSSSEYESELFKDSFPEENFSDPVYYSPAFPQCGIFGMLIERFDEIIRSEPSSYNHSFLLLRLKNESIDSEIIYASECFMEHFKPPVEDIIGKPWRTLYGHVDKDRLESWQAMNLSGMKLQSRFQYPGKQSHEYACLHAECVLYDHKKRDEVQEVEHDPRDVWDCLAYAENIVLRIRSIMRDSIYDLFPKYHKYVTNFDLGRASLLKQQQICFDIPVSAVWMYQNNARDYHKQLVDAYHERRRQPGPVDTCKVPEELKEQNERMKDTSKKLEEMLLMRKEIQNDANLEDMWEQ
ncbi:hypothetical protein GUITHDRAFT_133302 [Guillardia theta CCMP2712]|uniref:Uncharacterized protein n=1 Tax=Guillardia theta (strain CCMP2712) TaxID=905079 RepID=L1JXG0_GUITC|nr:hypothetical protein GUITHDRAFT_133302 [Guillardia theta CCMP2712]EKX52890.1 hypothetical protein GUITHDRAFT_133302 [Guillardia theta CCMP2712]|eukprot:XP_005839870.1 hypothetical protein GUITHDRAFT_133302 [Guillardia theta CCMP2712]